MKERPAAEKSSLLIFDRLLGVSSDLQRVVLKLSQGLINTTAEENVAEATTEVASIAHVSFTTLSIIRMFAINVKTNFLTFRTTSDFER